MRHPLLDRQLERLGLDQNRPPTDKQWQDLLRQISNTYAEAYQARFQLEQSLSRSAEQIGMLQEQLGTAEPLGITLILPSFWTAAKLPKHATTRLAERGIPSTWICLGTRDF